MAGYYTAYPAILQQSLATLLPYLENLKDHLTRGDPSSPFSGAAKAAQKLAPRNRQPRSRPNNTNKQRQPANAPASYRPSTNTSTHRPKWGPNGQIALQAQASSSGPDQIEIARLQAVIANMTGGPGQHAYNGMPSDKDPYSHV